MTTTASHEMVEAMTDPAGSGWNDPSLPPGQGEIGDLAANETYVQDGSQVQYMWSNALEGPAHAPSTGANDLFINQVAAPAVSGFTGGPVATFTDANTSLTASSFNAEVDSFDASNDTDNVWNIVSITGSNGHFVINATPNPALQNGSFGTPFNQDGLYVYVSTSPLNFSGHPSGAPISIRYVPYVINSSAPLIYNADSSSGTNNFVLTEAGSNFQLSDNGLVVFTQPVAETTSIDINADPAVAGDAGASVNDSLTIDYSGGVFTNAVTFDGGPGSGAHSITLRGGSFGSDTYTPTSSNSGSVTLSNGQTITFTHVSSVVDTDTAANFTLDGTSGADQINVGNGAAVSGTTPQRRSAAATALSRP